MTIEPTPSNTKQPRDAVYWAKQISTLKLTRVPAGVLNLNVEGHQVVGPLQGFGPMWQKIYWIALKGSDVTPTELIKVWKERFPQFWPKGSRFYPSLNGIAPGEVALIHSVIPAGLPIPISTGAFVLYADEESFTLMSLQGHPLSAWNTFSAYEDEGSTIAQINILMRASDPIYEAGLRLAGSRRQDDIWLHSLTSLAAYFGVKTNVQMQERCIDPGLRWSEARNIWQNAMIRTVFYWMVYPAIWVYKRIK